MSTRATASDRTAANAPARRIALGDTAVEYRLVRARRRSIGMLVNGDGLTVRAPRWATLQHIEAALAQRASWILATLAQWQEKRGDALPSVFESGAPILFQGRSLALSIFESRRRSIDADLVSFTVRHPSPGDEPAVAAYVTDWMKAEALAHFAARTAHFATQIDRVPRSLRLSNARTQWGSCNRNGDIRLHWRLVQLPARLADYVIAHEVAHLVELNHAPRFWRVVETLFPDHASARRELHALAPLLA